MDEKFSGQRLRGPLGNWMSFYLHIDFTETLILYVKRNSKSPGES